MAVPESPSTLLKQIDSYVLKDESNVLLHKLEEIIEKKKQINAQKEKEHYEKIG